MYGGNGARVPQKVPTRPPKGKKMEIDFTPVWDQIDEKLQELKVIKRNKFVENITAACKALVEFGEAGVTNPYFTGDKFDPDKENIAYLYFTVNTRFQRGLETICVQITEYDVSEKVYNCVLSKLIDSKVYGKWPEIPSCEKTEYVNGNVVLQFADKTKYVITPDKLQVKNK